MHAPEEHLEHSYPNAMAARSLFPQNGVPETTTYRVNLPKTDFAGGSVLGSVWSDHRSEEFSSTILLALDVATTLFGRTTGSIYDRIRYRRSGATEHPQRSVARNFPETGLLRRLASGSDRQIGDPLDPSSKYSSST